MKSKSNYSETIVEVFVGKHEKVIILIFCLAALVRIFLFSCAFPFFNNVDEQAHFDTVVKYARGYLPRKGDNYFHREAAGFIAVYKSPEYLADFTELESEGELQPLWLIRDEEATAYIIQKTATWMTRKNHEAYSPPVYYASAGVWYNLGKALGLEGGHLLYWIRFLNVGIYGLLLLFSYWFCRALYKDNLFLRIGVPLLLIFFPQDVFYAINSDVFSPLLFLVALYFLIQIHDTERTFLFYLVTGLMIAAAFLTKFSNVCLLVVFFLFLFSIIKKSHAAGRLRKRGANLFVLVLTAAVPITLWLGWNAYALGDITGSAEKLEALHWKVKPLIKMGDHPLFTGGGAIYFLTDLIKTFWRGELVWRAKTLAWAGTDLFFVISSGIFVLAAMIGPLLCKNSCPAGHRRLNYINMFVLCLFVLFLGVLSVMYDFADSWYPSQESPYFTSGRLISGALIPFVILYLDGLGFLASRISRRISPLAVVFFIAVFIAGAEIYLTYEVFASPFNWFHMF
ncbi:MAG: hypothetical protein AMJ79_05895 [Phycisphaerae bacterium SM23_30]|nr:MAG: hypothetical protein AMJ79_05895 [Phycisphaerae bacterium SM23_30]